MNGADQPAAAGSKTQAHHVFGLDVMRAAAICMVLVSHTWPWDWAKRWAGGVGMLGVELFFVLSGFLIGGILLRQQAKGRLKSWKDLLYFWRRRWFRTLPNYYLFLALRMAWREWYLGFEGVAVLLWEYFFFVQNVRQQPPLFFPASWSLSVEEWYYLLFPLVLVIATWAFRASRAAWLVSLGVFIVVPTVLRVRLVLAMEPTVDEAFWLDTVRKGVVYRLDSLMYGMVMAWAAQSKGWKKLRPWSWLGLLILVLATTSLAFHVPVDLRTTWTGLVLLPGVSLGACLVLPAFTAMPEANGPWARAARCTAKWAYSLYLCHGLVGELLAELSRRLSIGWLATREPIWCLFVWVLSFATASLVYARFEKPIMDLRDQ